MFAVILFFALIAAFVQQSEGFTFARILSQQLSSSSSALFSENAEANKDMSKDSVGDREESKQVVKGLTHIKYNKYAPTAEEAAGMTDEQFRGTIFRRMKEAENERKKSGPIGSAVSDDYINSLSKKRE